MRIEEVYLPAFLVALVPLSAFCAWLYFLKKESVERLKKGI